MATFYDRHPKLITEFVNIQLQFIPLYKLSVVLLDGNVANLPDVLYNSVLATTTNPRH